MKIVLVFSLVVLCAVVFQPAEASWMTKKQPGPQTKDVSFKKHAGDYLRGKFIKGVKAVKEFASSMWEAVNEGIKFLKNDPAKFWPTVEDKIKEHLRNFTNDFQELKATLKKLPSKLSVNVQKKLLKTAQFIVSVNTTAEEIGETVEKDFQEITDLESKIYETVQSGKKNNKCAVACKEKAMTMKDKNLRIYAKCNSNAHEGVKIIGKFLLNTVITLGPGVLLAAKSLTLAQANPALYFNFAVVLGRILLKDVPKVFADGKKKWADLRKTAQKGSKCIIDQFNKAKKEWDKLFETLAKC